MTDHVPPGAFAAEVGSTFPVRLGSDGPIIGEGTVLDADGRTRIRLNAAAGGGEVETTLTDDYSIGGAST